MFGIKRVVGLNGTPPNYWRWGNQGRLRSCCCGILDIVWDWDEYFSRVPRPERRISIVQQLAVPASSNLERFVRGGEGD